jgi:hypothetical protein
MSGSLRQLGRARAVIAALAFALLALASAEARAEPGRVALVWRAPEGCGDGAAVTADVERLVRGSESTERVEAEAEVIAADGAYRVRLRTRARGEIGERVVAAASCAQVASATAVILALMIDPTAAGRAAEEEGAPVPKAVPTPARAPTAAPVERGSPPSPAGAPDAVSTPTRASTQVAVVVSASFAGDAGTMPGASAGGGVALAALLGAYRIELRGALFPSASGALSMRPTAGADFSMLVVGLDGCRALVQHPRARADVCAGAEVDRVSAQGHGVSSPASGSTTFGAAALDALLDVPLASKFSAVVRGGAAAPFIRSPFYFEGLGTVHRPSAVAGRVAGGVAVHF